MNSLGKEKTTDKKGGNVISFYVTNLSSVAFMRIYRCMFCNTMQEYIRVTNIEYNYNSVVSFLVYHSYFISLNDAKFTFRILHLHYS